MTDKEKNRIVEIRWRIEREEKRSKLETKLNSILPKNSFEFLSFEESDSFQSKTDDWPNDKWKENLYFQTELEKAQLIENIIKSFLCLIKGSELYIFLMNYNFGLIKLSKEKLIDNWVELIEIDNDEIYLFNPKGTEFICIEKTEEFISERENEGRKWIYEMTFSNKKLKEKCESTTHNNV
ncbi:hypothetical protein Fleli_2373 [Bernardetia litoralis DSM 6794]|uniref:Uncharacterized protein n=1 Tax=Bernardetia litoralis (strain ATCC 23117 / DSM 6794 / NBRC 15988 / NCIMB 1366 / Fx l1 / Sio-4) TaxID=880071 RepID=I4ALB0_BERLS|nr:hypothetical protein [Bernardetia litoralis]AFM04745.1 hypothetical protein Fleli_2373 [Bernardetia litoralis DSM 6794]